ncbi:hypothetical protein [Streptomyces sp. NPDC047108]|uniref:helix-turn-helix domain-containing protein n=1 Tax=Streptomyces sp. NPDC047108 TaxID=3155025 RepID=UPI0033C839EF
MRDRPRAQPRALGLARVQVSREARACLDPTEALVSFAAVGAAPEEAFASRGWSEEEWAAARERLVTRGWLDVQGGATERGRAGREEVERRPDELAAAPWRTLAPQDAGTLARLTMPVVQAVVASGMLPAQNTLGIGAAGTR